MNNISIIIHSHNEELNIKECILSARLLSANIILIDGESSDKTISLAKENGAKVYSFPYSSYVEPAREFGISKTDTDWVFILDADERITPELSEEIKSVIIDKKYTYYKIPRKNIFGKTKWLKHGGWWPDHQIRLINKNFFKSWPKEIHSTAQIEGQMGFLKNPILHFSHGDFENMVKKTIIFEAIESHMLYKGNKNANTLIFFRKFLGELYKRLIKRSGFLDGEVGIMESIYQAFSKTITYFYLYEKKKTCLPAGRIALYDPYLDVLGGGENYILSILKVLEEENYDISIFWDKDLTLEIKKRFDLNFRGLSFLPNIFKSKTFLLNKFLTLRQFEIFIYVTDGSYFFSPAKKNFIYAMIPKKDLYSQNTINKIKRFNYKIITHSHFNQNILKKWGLNSELIYPFLKNDYIGMKINNLNKDKIILSIGRFFKHLHSKRQDIIINMFNKFKQQNPLLNKFQLILAGGLKKEDNDYFEKLVSLKGNNNNIILKPNLTYQEILSLYKNSLIYWHFAGYGVDENTQPELTEHLGLTPLEAMACGCITFCYAAGGPREMIKDGQNGFLFHNEEELFNKMDQILNNETQQKEIIIKAKKFINDNFSYPTFQQTIINTFLK